ncbi:MAG: HEAT repeat domain-containing protein, partial [Elusimicrobia bacterium]|nr:HEAT repeat domain-containing protein [Elusimicrobiota bacterium]
MALPLLLASVGLLSAHAAPSRAPLPAHPPQAAPAAASEPAAAPGPLFTAEAWSLLPAPD